MGKVTKGIMTLYRAASYSVSAPSADSNNNEEEQEILLATEILSMMFLLMLAISAGHFLKKSGHKYLQEAGLTTLIGMAAGFLLKTMNIDTVVNNITDHFSTLFLILLLPPIIFESGYNMDKKPFFKNIGTVLMFSFLGTFIAISFSTCFFYLVGLTGASYKFSFGEAFAFGSLISATDPVAVLSIFKEMDANENLYAVVFGESIFNDAIGIVMFQSVIESLSNDSGDSIGVQIKNATGKFLLIFIGSIVIGAMTALIAAFVQKRQSQYSDEITAEYEKKNINIRQQNFEDEQNFQTEISLILMCPWVSYLVADGLELSPIVAILTNGIFLNYYATPNVNRASRKVIKIVVDTVAYITETIVFLFLGIGVFAFNHDKAYSEMGFGTVIFMIINLNLARALNIQTVSFLVNAFRPKSEAIPRNQKFVMWIAGLRGAMAYALALQSSKNTLFNNETNNAGSVMLILTILYSLFTILGISSFLNTIMVSCHVTRDANAETADEDNNGVEQQLLDNISQNEKKKGRCNQLKQKISEFDKYYFSPLFIKDIQKIEKRDQRKLEDYDDRDWSRQSEYRSKDQMDQIKQAKREEIIKNLNQKE